MKFTVLQENLKNYISLCSRFTSQKTQLPILGNILIKANKSKITLNSTNLETSVSVSLGAKIEKEGEISIPSRVIGDIITNLSSGPITLEENKENVKITSSKFTSRLVGMNPSDFPLVPSSIPEKGFLRINMQDFKKSLEKTIFSVSVDETRPVLTGVLFVFLKNKLSMVSTDGFRLSKNSIKIDNLSEPFSIIIPKTILGEVLKNEAEEFVDFYYNTKENHVVFKISDIIYSSRIIEGEFPDYEKIIPGKFIYKILLDREEFAQAVKLASVFAKDSGNIVKLQITNDKLQVKSESSASGSQTTNIEIKVEAEDVLADGKIDFEVAYNYKFLEDFIRNVEDEGVSIELTTPDKPGKFLDPKNPNYLHLIMPIKLQS